MFRYTLIEEDPDVAKPHPVNSAVGRTLVILLALFGAVPSLFQPSTASASVDAKYVRTVYDGTIWEVTAEGAVPLSWPEWEARGFPAFQNADTQYGKVLDLPTVYASTTFTPDIQLVEAITFPELQAAGFPRIVPLPWIEDIAVHQWSGSPELFATDRNGYVQKLNWSQWSGAGFPSFEVRDNRGFVQMSWDATGGIAYMCDIAAGRGGRLTWDQWSSLGFPTPQRVTRTSNDTVLRIDTPWNVSRGTISYVGPVTVAYPPTIGSGRNLRDLTYSEWRSMGSPTPWLTNTYYPENYYCNSTFLSPWE